MPRQNRVTPFGHLIATPARGAWMGNRGCLHDAHGQIRRHHRGVRWIYCRLHFKNRRRTIMAPGRYTELFFLDEATALAAGHRPCAECLRPRFTLFRTLWAQANPQLMADPTPAAGVIDAVLHRERLTAQQTKATYVERLGHLPDGSFITVQPDGAPSDLPCLLLDGVAWRWTPHGYAESWALSPDSRVHVLTPRSIVRMLAGGYRPQIHPTHAGIGSYLASHPASHLDM